jgi:hypothetical protein
MIITDLHQTPSDTLDYTIDFTSWLNLVSDTISSVTWTIPAPLTGSSQTNTSYTATTYLAGGTPGQPYRIDCQITTAASPARIKTASFTLKIEAD